jgi:hypothetical protein
MRKENPVLVYGDLNFTIVDDKNMVLAYSRKMDNKEITVVFNRSGKIQTVQLPDSKGREYLRIFSTGGTVINRTSSDTEIKLEPISAIVLSSL